MNDHVIYGSKKITFDEGYWTFNAIKDKLVLDGITLERNVYDNKCKVLSTNSNLNLKTFAPLLGFPENHTIDVNQGLRYVTISCDSVNSLENFDVKGKRSYIVTTLPVTSEQHLNASVTSFRNVESQVAINNGSYNEFPFKVNTNISSKVDMAVLF